MGLGQWSLRVSKSLRRFLELCFIAGKQRFGKRSQKPRVADSYFSVGIIHFNLEQNSHWESSLNPRSRVRHVTEESIIYSTDTEAESEEDTEIEPLWEHETEDGLIKAFRVIPKPQESLKYFPVGEFDYWRCQVDFPSDLMTTAYQLRWRFIVVQPESGTKDEIKLDSESESGEDDTGDQNKTNCRAFERLTEFIKYAMDQPEFFERIASVTEPWPNSIFVNI